MARRKHKAFHRNSRRRSGSRRVSARVGTSISRNGRHRAGLVAPRKETVDPQIAAMMKLYAEAMKHFNRQGYRRAREIFEKVLVGPSRELADRARVHLAICEQRMQREAPVHLRSADDHYHYAVSQINLGNYEEARTHLERARKLAPKADYVYYALASVFALTGETDEAVNLLAQAIKLRPENRFHARNDDDFRLLHDEPRFLELLYPERPVGPAAREARA
ncbi:MAG TPA: tetratricopeptide repeat protein [Candidatus Xenobia bacterium]|nr:tetratricopeptide repeat protein [Candidatus Xenobia bacterium]